MRKIRICSNKGLLLLQDTLSAAATAAVLCTSIGVNTDRYDWLDAKLLLSFDMLVGRLEIFPMLLLFAPSVWRRSGKVRK